MSRDSAVIPFRQPEAIDDQSHVKGLAGCWPRS
jgi:hypothetical protein